MTSFKQFLKDKFPAFWGFLRWTYLNTIRYHATPKSRRDKYFFHKLFRTNRNHHSFDFENGIVCGEFETHRYLLKCRPANFIETSVYEEGAWEPHLLKLMSSFISKNTIMLDIGANIGAISIPLAKKHSLSEFHCFEPHPDVFRDLKFNLAINKLNNVIPVQKIVCDKESENISFFAQQVSSNDNLGLSALRPNIDLGAFKEIKTTGTSIDVHCRSLDQTVSVIKIDVQGAELDVLESAKHVLENHRPVIFFEFEEEYYKSEIEAAEAKLKLIELFSEFKYVLHAIVGTEIYLPKLNFYGYFHGDIVALPSS